jgi:asparagine synthase (glutamine-hydrolysing)
MCGIAALIEPGRRFAAPLLAAVERDLHHRGPDSGGILAEPGVALVHRRLAILDPTARADQPMSDPSGRFAITYNGELYNYRELRAALAAEGVEFRTDGDTEALLLGYARWGEAVLDRLEGMYAFALLDRARQVVVAARDPFGIKPLYLLRHGQTLMLASEMRPMRSICRLEPDPEALPELLTYGWAAGRLSNLRRIERVPGGTVLTIGIGDGRVQSRRFADPLDTLQPDPTMTPAAAETQAREALFASIRAHLASDVGYAVQLSGGVDSSLVAAVAQRSAERRLTTFGLNIVGYRHDERPYRELLARHYGFEHHEVPVTGSDFAAAFDKAVEHIEGPSPHLGCILLMLLCSEIRKVSKVALTGEGGDEFFGGYLRYGTWRKTRWQERLGRLLPARYWPQRPPFAGIRRLAGTDAAAISGVYGDFQSLHRLFPELVPKPGLREAVSRRFRAFVDRLLAVDQSSYLESLLMRQDKVSMAVSVETRVPFVHWPLARTLNRIPHAIRVPGGETKPLLKRIAAPLLPAELLHRRKIGLWLPLEEWLRDDAGLAAYVDALTDQAAPIGGYAGRANVRRAVEAFRARRPGSAWIVMRLVNLDRWLRSVPASAAPG